MVPDTSFKATNNQFVAEETKPTFANNINNTNSANMANTISGKPTLQLNPLVDDNITGEVSSGNLDLHSTTRRRRYWT